MPDERRIASCCTIACVPTGKYLHEGFSQCKDDGGGVGAVAVGFVFDRFHERGKQVEIARHGHDSASAFAKRCVAFAYGMTEGRSRVMRRCAMCRAENCLVRRGKRVEMANQLCVRG